MKHVLALALAALGLVMAAPAAAQQDPAPTPTQQAQAQKMRAILESLHPVSGDVALPGASATLHLGKDFYYLPPDEARKVIVDAWGNPPRVADDVLGIVFPTGKTFLDDTWGAAITYEASGYVTDKDAQTADYDALLKQLQSGEEEINTKRREEGYPAQHLIGWAQPPSACAPQASRRAGGAARRPARPCRLSSPALARSAIERSAPMNWSSARLRFRLGRLDQHRAVDDQREIHGHRVEALVDQRLGEVERVTPVPEARRRRTAPRACTARWANGASSILEAAQP
jgi:hypothetical protein